MFTLSDAPNTYNAALLVIKKKGYNIRIDPSDDEYEIGDWVAYNDERQFFAANPLMLLGLVALFDERGEDWQRKSGEDNLYDAILENTYPE
ncbi:MAG: hypothetical protein QTN59_09900 [Candidatus Electrothrix communis]|nr:MAG: hypothetical protein QTN59_09900 [Candidatus Electrothrix communis]